jgi:hypothetical protein
MASAVLNPVATDRAFDLSQTTVRTLNQWLHAELAGSGVRTSRCLNPDGAHSIAVGLDTPVSIDIRGHAGYYCGGMNKLGRHHRARQCGLGRRREPDVGQHARERLRIRGRGGDRPRRLARDRRRCVAALWNLDEGHRYRSGRPRGGFLRVHGQAGTLVVCGDAGDALGDSLYEAVIYVRGRIKSLGADAREEPLSADDRARLSGLLKRAGFAYDPGEFKRVASAGRCITGMRMRIRSTKATATPNARRRERRERREKRDVSRERK